MLLYGPRWLWGRKEVAVSGLPVASCHTWELSQHITVATSCIRCFYSSIFVFCLHLHWMRSLSHSTPHNTHTIYEADISVLLRDTQFSPFFEKIRKITVLVVNRWPFGHWTILKCPKPSGSAFRPPQRTMPKCRVHQLKRVVPNREGVKKNFFFGRSLPNVGGWEKKPNHPENRPFQPEFHRLCSQISHKP